MRSIIPSIAEAVWYISPLFMLSMVFVPMTFFGVSNATLGSWDVFSQSASAATPMPAPIEVPRKVLFSSIREKVVAVPI